MRSALSNRTNKGRNVNMLLHLLGYFSDSLSKEEKSFFLDSLQMYQEEKVPFLVPLSIIKSWSLRFNNEYLLRQKIFEAFPTDLLELKDSGK
ncbi:YbgA family protein [Paraclostridium bifermentans]|uniref:YbgA family protein n=1 Tax=Paraclostridium bifermentans TaxID=1490 RepID=UPI0021C3096D|nr:YbgA family protein [Paraclostridium bifermentans]